jgi:hypothetical protein
MALLGAFLAFWRQHGQPLLGSALVIFDRRDRQPPISQRTSAAVTTSPADRSVTVIRA